MREATTQPRRLMAQNIDDWYELVTATNPRPTPEHGYGAGFIEEVKLYNQRIGTIPTRDVRAVAAAIRQAHYENDHASYGSAACVILNGPPVSGKTHAALSCAFGETRTIWNSLGHHPDDPGYDRSIPWIYVEVPKQARGLSLLKAIWTFCGVPPLRGHATASDYLAALRRLAPRIGLRGIIVDDSHGLGMRQSADSRLLADTLKGLVTGLPATIVLIGTGFEETGVLHGSGGDQVRLRGARWIEVGKWAPPVGNDFGSWGELGRALKDRLMLPNPGQQIRLTNPRVLRTLIDGSQQRPGLAVMWAKRAALHAIAHDTDLDVAALSATHAAALEGITS